MSSIIQVALGGAFGAVCRYLAVTGAGRAFGLGFPYGTLGVNILGSFLIGMAYVALLEKDGGALARHAPLVMAGFLGGFTTFSAFSLDVINLIEKGRFAAMGFYVCGSVGLSVLAVILGLLLARNFLI